ncbi:MAG: hypothetical protein R6X18_12340 [Chloroflexota bacterium]|jgi:hypothetical protein
MTLITPLQVPVSNQVSTVPYPPPTTGKQRRKSPSSRYRRTVPIPSNKPLSAKARHDLLQLLTNHRTDLEINSANEGARLLLLEIVTQAIIDLLNKRATPANREDALAFFRGEVYAIYMSMLDLGQMGFPQAIEALLLQSGSIQGHETRSAKE